VVVRMSNEETAWKWRLSGLFVVALLVLLSGFSTKAGAGACSSPGRSALAALIPSQSPLPTLTCRIIPFSDPVFDPAATEFNALLPYGAMSFIAPTMFGDFQSATEVSFSGFKWSGAVMPEGAGLDPTTTSMVSDVEEQDLLVNDAALTTDPIGLNAKLADLSVAGGATHLTNRFLSTEEEPDTATALDPTTGASGLEASCGTKIEAKLQTGGQFWNGQTAAPAPVEFPNGVFTRILIQNPLGDLGQTGDPINLPKTGPGGSWCNPLQVPFLTSSPLEEDVVWIMLYVVFGSFLVAWLSRGHRLPAI
jgi:hypothetical protein